MQAELGHVSADLCPMSTFERYLLTFAAAAAMAAPGAAQPTERRATFTGNGGNDAGKCTIEVYVDGSADVEVRGDSGLLRTLAGQPAQWRRFVCSGPMPANPADFQFIGVDGRGRQELIQDPRNNPWRGRREDSGSRWRSRGLHL